VKSYLFDASAILAFLNKETGQEIVGTLFEHDNCLVTAVNLAEVLYKLRAKRFTEEETRQILTGLPLEIVPCTLADAWISSSFYPQAKDFGLSLGDRICLATGKRLKIEVVTADKRWKIIKAPPCLKLIR